MGTITSVEKFESLLGSFAYAMDYGDYTLSAKLHDLGLRPGPMFYSSKFLLESLEIGQWGLNAYFNLVRQNQGKDERAQAVVIAWEHLDMIINGLENCKTWLEPVPDDSDDDDDLPGFDVRLNISPDGQVNLLSGDPQYDQDHRGHWAGDWLTNETNCEQMALELILSLE